MVQKKQTAFRFSVAEKRLLAKIAKDKGWSQAAVIREAFRIFAKQEGYR
jgi:predicted DNA-binding protein